MILAEQEALALIVGRLVERFRPLKIILFGSRARGDAPADSDFDLVVVLAEAEDRLALRVEALRTLGDLPVFKDVIIATESETREGGRPGSVLRSALLILRC